MTDDEIRDGGLREVQAAPRLVLLEAGHAASGADDSMPGARSSIVHVVATRPDAVALAPVVRALERRGVFRQVILHTGQDSDPALTTEIFTDLDLPRPEYWLDTGRGTHAQQTSRALERSEVALAEIRPAAVVVTGGANSSLGCALAAVKLQIPVARLEAGLRERDRRVPEEINRTLIDTLADTLFAPTEEAAAAARASGAGEANVYVSGSTVVDGLRRTEQEAVRRRAWERFGVDRWSYVLVTLHRPVNVDVDERLARIVEALAELAREVPVIFPLHPRTRERLLPMGDAHRLLAAGVLCAPSLGYIDFLSLQAGAGAVVTDSGTVQEEASALGVRCYTLLGASDRAHTITHGTNVLLGDDLRDVADIRPTPGGPSRRMTASDGRAGERVAAALVANYALVPAAGAV